VPARGAPAAASLEDVYRRALDDRQPQMRAIIGALAAPGALLAVVHCTAGKDRTGLVVALLLEVAGVSRETVVADYALTREYLTGQYFDEARERAAKAGYDWAVYQRLLECPPELMAATLAYLDNRYGGAADYLCRIGVTDAEIAALRNGLTEPMGETT
jgi:protein-tyrosine phosphatase